MFFFKLLKFSCVAAISFNFWSLFWQVGLRFPSLMPAYWSLLVVLIILHLGLMLEPAQIEIANSIQGKRGDVAIANGCAFFACLFSLFGSILGVIF